MTFHGPLSRPVNPIAQVDASLKSILISYFGKSWNTNDLWVLKCSSAQIWPFLTSQWGMSGRTRSPENSDQLHTDMKWPANSWNSNHWFLSYCVDKWLADADRCQNQYIPRRIWGYIYHPSFVSISYKIITKVNF